MTAEIDARLKELGLKLPEAPAPAANYVPWVRTGNLVHVSGQISQGADGPIKGKLGAGMSVEDGAAAARACALSLLAQVRAACGGDLSRLVRVVKLTGFVNSTPDFGDQPKVINGASDTLVAILGDKGRHARSAVSAASLPFGVAVEIEGIFEVECPRPSRSSRCRRSFAGRPWPIAACTTATRAARRTRAPPSVPPSKRATASNATCSSRPTAARWCSTTTSSTA